MLGLATSPPAAAAAFVHPAVAGLAEQRTNAVAVEPVRRVAAIGTRPANRRSAPFTPVRDDETRAARLAGARGRVAARGLLAHAPAGAGLPSTPFLAQYIAQALGPPTDGDAREFEPGRFAYRVAAERNTTYLGFAGPVDLVV
ncbi:MAG: hypothetical protein ACE5H8_02495 [Alphaproteobacteria bacterium]